MPAVEVPPVGADRPPVRRARLGTVVAWGVIVFAVVLVLARGQSRRGREAAAATRETTQPATRAAAGETDVSQVRNPGLVLVSRYVVGAAKWMGGGAASPATTTSTAPATTPVGVGVGSSAPGRLNPAVRNLLAEVEAEAKTPIDRFRVIAVVGELAGGDEALERVEQFERAHQVVVLRRDVDLLREMYSHGREAVSEEDREYLIWRHGWFGKLAVSHGAPADDPVRRQALGAATRLTVLLGAMMIAGLGGLLVGVVLLVLALVRFSNGMMRAVYVRPARWRAGPFVEVFALCLGGFLAFSLVMALILGERGMRSIWPSAAVVVVLPLVVGWLRLRGMSKEEVWVGLGWQRGRGVVREAFAGVVGYVAGLPILGLGFLVTAWLIKRTGVTAEHPIIHHALDQPLEALGVLVLACVVAPVVEETMFRGALFHHLRGWVGFLVSAAVSSFVFAAIHPQGWAAIPVLGALAFVFAGIRQWRGSIIGPVVAHSLNNGVVTVMLLVGMT